jgi:uncharacterized protein (DUF58 family)
MTAAELRSKVRQLELRARKTMTIVTPGAYRSAFRGKGVEFDEIREYVPGDDARSIDWNVTARLGRPHLKRFSEEREQSLLFLLDASRSMVFGSASHRKLDSLAEIFSVLAFAAASNIDEVGLILFTDKVEQYIPPAKGIVHVQRLIREVIAFEPRGNATNLAGALEFFLRVRRKRSFAFVLSDFLADRFQPELRACAARHDLVALSIFDVREEILPDCGLVEIEDPESASSDILDTGDPKVRGAFADAARIRRENLSRDLRSIGVDHLRIEAGSNFIPQLAQFLRAHAKTA